MSKRKSLHRQSKCNNGNNTQIIPSETIIDELKSGYEEFPSIDCSTDFVDGFLFLGFDNEKDLMLFTENNNLAIEKLVKEHTKIKEKTMSTPKRHCSLSRQNSEVSLLSEEEEDNGDGIDRETDNISVNSVSHLHTNDNDDIINQCNNKNNNNTIINHQNSDKKVQEISEEKEVVVVSKDEDDEDILKLDIIYDDEEGEVVKNEHEVIINEGPMYEDITPEKTVKISPKKELKEPEDNIVSERVNESLEGGVSSCFKEREKSCEPDLERYKELLSLLEHNPMAQKLFADVFIKQSVNFSQLNPSEIQLVSFMHSFLRERSMSKLPQSENEGKTSSSCRSDSKVVPSSTRKSPQSLSNSNNNTLALKIATNPCRKLYLEPIKNFGSQPCVVSVTPGKWCTAFIKVALKWRDIRQMQQKMMSVPTSSLTALHPDVVRPSFRSTAPTSYSRFPGPPPPLTAPPPSSFSSTSLRTKHDQPEQRLVFPNRLPNPFNGNNPGQLAIPPQQLPFMCNPSPPFFSNNAMLHAQQQQQLFLQQQALLRASFLRNFAPTNQNITSHTNNHHHGYLPPFAQGMNNMAPVPPAPEGAFLMSQFQQQQLQNNGMFFNQMWPK